jgi:hypothetical protein
MWFCGCCKGCKNFDLKTKNEVSNPWYHGCFWDCVPQYRLQLNCETSFPKHFKVIKTTFCSGKTLLVDGVEIFVSKVFNAKDLDNQQNMFKLTMKSTIATCMAPPFDINHLTKM